jgi:hypothetical protein
MRNIHRIIFKDEPGRRQILTSLGIGFHEPVGPLVPLVWFDIEEDTSAYAALKSYLFGWDAADNAGTIFTTAEIQGASWLAMRPKFAWGYPQPEDDSGYLDLSFDLTNYCRHCGTGSRQIAPIRFSGEPTWGKRHILQTNWIFDEYFAQPATWQDLFRPFGVECMPVIHHKTNKELKTVVQLKLENTATSRLEIATDHPYELCAECGRIKYNPITIDFYPNFVLPQTRPILRSQEFFGSGGSAWNEIVVSRDLFAHIREKKCAGVDFIPLAG